MTLQRWALMTNNLPLVLSFLAKTEPNQLLKQTLCKKLWFWIAIWLDHDEEDKHASTSWWWWLLNCSNRTVSLSNLIQMNGKLYTKLTGTQWEVLAIFGSLQNPDVKQILGPPKVDFFNFGAIFADFSYLAPNFSHIFKFSRPKTGKLHTKTTYFWRPRLPWGPMVHIFWSLRNYGAFTLGFF